MTEYINEVIYNGSISVYLCLALFVALYCHSDIRSTMVSIGWSGHLIPILDCNCYVFLWKKLLSTSKGYRKDRGRDQSFQRDQLIYFSANDGFWHISDLYGCLCVADRRNTHQVDRMVRGEIWVSANRSTIVEIAMFNDT